jgi:L-rhamnose mutarotase
MRLRPGAAAEYKRRHDAIWPELARLLSDAGLRHYSIHLDPVDGVTLFAVVTVTSSERYAALPDSLLMRKWWASMRDLMETDASDRPLTWPLERVFELR